MAASDAVADWGAQPGYDNVVGGQLCGLQRFWLLVDCSESDCVH